MPHRALSHSLASALVLVAVPAVAQSAGSRPAATPVTGPARSGQQAPIATTPRTPPPPMPKATFLANVDKEFEAMDGNKDKRLTKAEIEQFRARAIATRRQRQNRALFTQLDIDKNGYLSAQEFERVGGPVPTVNAQPLIDKMDGNKDQQVTAAEYRAGAAADFDRLDANKDGALSPAEARSNQPSKR